MKIWLDFINTPQVSFFIPFIREFEKDNHQVFITCRDSGNTVDLLKINGLNFQIVGDKVRKGTFNKILYFPVRLYKLFKFVKGVQPDVAASQSSFYQPFISWLLSVPCVYTNDNEHAKGNLIAFPFATKVVLPEVMQSKNFTKKWPLLKKLSFYPSVKEAIYLSQIKDRKTYADSSKKVIYFRPEPWSAQYYKGPVNFFDDAILKLSNDYSIIILPRDGNQKEYYKQPKFKSLQVAEKALSLNEITMNCLIFIGAGGSMTRELAVLGFPVISIYQAELLEVDKYLINKGLILMNPKVSFEDIKNFIDINSSIERENKTLNEGFESYSLIKNLILTLKK
ncbi:MAG: DUF354 domain-containing protein [Bacteroidales bacterium]|nr:DUF354 domain-containing protein [Bacteroidales bacterium]